MITLETKNIFHCTTHYTTTTEINYSVRILSQDNRQCFQYLMCTFQRRTTIAHKNRVFFTLSQVPYRSFIKRITQSFIHKMIAQPWVYGHYMIMIPPSTSYNISNMCEYIMLAFSTMLETSFRIQQKCSPVKSSGVIFIHLSHNESLPSA